jgi:propionate CoA-transferase
MSKITTLHFASSLIQPRDILVCSGFVTQGCPNHLLQSIRERFDHSNSNNNKLSQKKWDLTLLFGGGPGDFAEKGLNHLATPGLVGTAIGGHFGQVPKLSEMVFNEQIAGYVLPLGSISRMIRCTASHSPSHVTRVGLGTFIDPRIHGPELNQLAKSQHLDLVQVISTTTSKSSSTQNNNSGGIEYLSYRALPVRVALIKATTADEDGNLTFERESLLGDSKVMAMAAKSSGGITIAQVARIVQRHSIPPRSVTIPGALVDYIVQVPDEPQSFFVRYDAAFSGEIRIPVSATTTSSTPLNNNNNSNKNSTSTNNTNNNNKDLPRDIIARRACLELNAGDVVNLGIGMPESVGVQARNEGIIDQVTLTTEMGTIGGIPASGHDFGPARNYQALTEMNSIFDFYNGGGLTKCFLGMGQVDSMGNVNVSRLQGRTLTGPGGFMDISQCTRRVIFVGTFTKKGLLVKIDSNGLLHIIQDGTVPTFVNQVDEITFNGKEALKNGQKVLYVTERCTFELNYRGIKLIEIAKGIDLERDILSKLPFDPHYREEEVKVMDPRIFIGGESGVLKGKMGLITDFHDILSFIHHHTEFWPAAVSLTGNRSNCSLILIDLSELKMSDLMNTEEFFDTLKDGILMKIKKEYLNTINSHQQQSTAAISTTTTTTTPNAAHRCQIVIKLDQFNILDESDKEYFLQTMKKLEHEVTMIAIGLGIHIENVGGGGGGDGNNKILLYRVGTLLRNETTYENPEIIELIWKDWIGLGKNRLSIRALRSALERDLSVRITPEDLIYIMGGKGNLVIERNEFERVLGRIKGMVLA